MADPAGGPGLDRTARAVERLLLWAGLRETQTHHNIQAACERPVSSRVSDHTGHPYSLVVTFSMQGGVLPDYRCIL